MSTHPRPLRRARLWTAGLLTASTVLVGAIGIHLADAQNATQTVATQTSSGTSDSTSSNASSSSGSSGSSDTSSDSSSSDDSSSSSGFSAVAPVSGSNVQAQTSSGGS